MAFPIPKYMIGIDEISGPVQVTREPEVVMQRENGEVTDRRKESNAFPGCTAYRVEVEYYAGERIKIRPNGEEKTVELLGQTNVTVWSQTPVTAHVDDYVVFEHLMVGGMQGGPYFQAQGLHIADIDEVEVEED